MPRNCSVWLIPTMLLLAGSLIPGFQRECLAEPSISLLKSTTAVPEGGLEDELLTLTNKNRVLQGLHALTPDEALVRIAREHSVGMARQGFISHELPFGDLKVRMSSGGYRYLTARENVATASSILYAQNALMQSPPHKENILAPDVDRIGIGIVRCPPPYDKELYITEIFASPREEHRPIEVEETLLSRVDELRKNGAGSLIPEPLLGKLAGESILSLNVPVQKEELRTLVANSAGTLLKNGKTEISRVDVNVQLLRDPKNLNIVNQGRIDQEARMFGSAIRQVVDSRNEPAFLVLTLIGFAK